MRGAVVTLLVAATAAVPGTAGAAETLYFESRDEVPVESRWDLRDIFVDLAAFDAATARVEAMLPRIESYRGRLGESAEILAEALELRFGLERTIEDVYVYAQQWAHTDTRDPAANAHLGRARSLLARANEATAFFQPEIVRIPEEKLAAMRASDALAGYGHFLDNLIRLRDHIRSQEVEQVLAGAALLTAAPQNLYTTFHNADMTWPEIEGADGEKVTATPSLFYTFMGSQDRELRRRASDAIFGTFQSWSNTYAAALAASIHKDRWLATTRGYDSVLASALDADNLPPEVVERLVAAVHDNLGVIHRYVELRKKVLGLDDFHIYDLYVSMVPAGDRSYSFDEGWALAMEFWRETFGDEYAGVAAAARAGRWIDVYPSAGKWGGAYSWGSYDSHPYLLLNWGGTLGDVFTLVHEMGHSIHSYLANANNPYHDAGYSLFVAELASVASESLFFEWMLGRTDDPTERLALLNHRLNTIIGTFLRQIFFHEFEARAHRLAADNQPITPESLGDAWGDLWTAYYGPEAVLDEAFRSGWARIHHFYRTFYVWKYASSFAAGEALAARFRSGDATAVDDYLSALKLGGSVYPMEALATAGIDMNDPAVVAAVMERFDAILDEMEPLLLEE